MEYKITDGENTRIVNAQLYQAYKNIGWELIEQIKIEDDKSQTAIESNNKESE